MKVGKSDENQIKELKKCQKVESSKNLSIGEKGGKSAKNYNKSEQKMINVKKSNIKSAQTW